MINTEEDFEKLLLVGPSKKACEEAAAVFRASGLPVWLPWEKKLDANGMFLWEAFYTALAAAYLEDDRKSATNDIRYDRTPLH
jgi:hypothetical protein